MRACFAAFLILLQILSFTSGYVWPEFTIKGQLLCKGVPSKGKIIMIDDNLIFDHLLNERKVEEDGQFTIYGEPEDDNLNVVLIVEHRCHPMKFRRYDRKPMQAYNEFVVNVEDLIKSNFELEMNIELSRNDAKISSPFLPFWRGLLYGKRIISDSLSRFGNQPFIRNFF